MIYDPNLPPWLRPGRDDPDVRPDRPRPNALGPLSQPYPQYMLVPIQPNLPPHVLPPDIVPPPGPIYLPGIPPGGGPAGHGYAAFMPNPGPPLAPPGLPQVPIPLQQPPMVGMPVPPPMDPGIILPQPPQAPQYQ